MCVCFPIQVDKACHGSSLRVLCRSSLNSHVYSDSGIEVFFHRVSNLNVLKTLMLLCMLGYFGVAIIH